VVGTLRRFVRQRRADPDAAAGRDDLIARLLRARDAGDDRAGGGLTERQLIDECATLFAAGHETTATRSQPGAACPGRGQRSLRDARALRH
jgi:cytochrome P450